MIIGCTNITYLKIGGNVDVGTMGSSAVSYVNPFHIGSGSKLETLVLGEGITDIGSYRFSNCANAHPTDSSSYGIRYFFPNLKTVVFPSTLQSIGTYAFKGAKLEELDFRGSISLDSSVFRNMTTLKRVHIEAGAIPSYAFADCTGLTSVELGEGVSSIGSYAFRNCTGLTRFEIPDSVTSCGANMIQGCTNITYLRIGGNADVGAMSDSYNTYVNPFYIGDGSKLETLVLGEGITEIGAYRFSNCANAHPTDSSSYGIRYFFPNLKTVVFPSTLQSIGTYAFKGAKLEELDFRGSISLDSSVFRNMTTLKRVHIEAGAIPSYAFADCTGLTSVELGEGVSSIGSSAFQNCTGLTSFTIPDSVTSCDYDMIRGCTNITYLKVGGNVDVGTMGSSAGSYVNPFYIGSGSKLETLVLGEGITEIGDYRFSNCANGSSSDSSSYGIRYFFPNLKTVLLPSTLVTLGTGNISAWKQVRQLYFGSALSSISETRAMPAGLTLYSDEENAALAAFAQAKGLSYIVGGERPQYTLTCVAPALSVSGRSLRVSDGTLAVTTGVEGEAAALPEGYAVLSEEEIAFGAAFLPAAPQVPAGYVFRGWYTDPDFNELLSLDKMPAADLTLYARIDAPVDVLYALPAGMGGTADEALPEGWALYERFTLQAGEVLPAPAAEPELPAGYVFGGWFFDPACTLRCPYAAVPADGLTLYARIVAPVDVLYALPAELGGTADEALPEGWALYERFTLQAGEALPVPAAEPEIAGYRFLGWFLDADCTARCPYTAVPAEGVLLYAGFERLTRIRFAVNLAAAGVPDESLPAGFRLYAEYALPFGSDVPWPADPAVEGWVFEGWFDSPALVNRFERGFVGSEDLTCYGKLSRLAPGGRYKPVSGGVELVRFQLEEGADSALYLPSVVNGQPVVSIGPNAFASGGVDVMYLPDTLVSVDPAAFEGSGIRSLIIGRGAQNFSTVGGVLYNKDATVLLHYPEARSSASYTMPDSVTQIAARALRNNPWLKTVSFSTALTEIGAEAFAGCTALTSVTLADSTQILRAGAFAGCAALQSFTAYGLTLIEDGGQNRVETIPRSIAKVYGPIGGGVLRDWFSYSLSDGQTVNFQYNQYPLTLSLDGETEELTSEAGLPLMAEIRNIRFDDGSFVAGWYRDAELTLPWDMDADVMPAQALTLYGTRTPLYAYETVTLTLDGEDLTGLRLTAYYGPASSLSVPASIGGTPVIALGGSFLSGAGTTVTTITIGSQVRQIDEGAMSAFGGTVVCDAGSAAAEWAAARGLSTSILQYTLSFVSEGETIPSRKAARGTALRLPTLSNAYRVFTGWYTDAAATQAAELDADGFYVMPGADTVLYAGWDREAESVPYTWTANNGEVTITGYTGTSTVVSLPETINGWPVTAVGESAFADSALRSIDLGAVTTVGESAFRGCASLESVSMAAVTAIGDDAFADCENLRAPGFGSGLTSIGDQAYARCGSLGSITLPDSLTSLGRGAFADCTGLKSLTLGAQLAAFRRDAVAGCIRLGAVNASAQNAELSSVDGVLYNKAGTKLLLYPQGRTAASFPVPNGVTEIGEGAFENAASLAQVTVPSSVTVLGRAAFAGSGLQSFTASGLREIGADAFLGCASLRSVEPGELLESIASGAFCGCAALTDVHIPASAALNTDDLLFTSGNVLITGVLGSSAQAYAEAYGLAFSDPNAAAVTAVTVDPASVVLQRGDSVQLSAAWEPAEAVSGTSISWYSSDESVAYVDENGLVSAMGGGTAVITAISGNGVRGECRVEVRVPVSALDGKVITLVPGQTVRLPGVDGEEIRCRFAGDGAGLSVSEDGIVAASAEGSWTVKLTMNGWEFASCEIRVCALTSLCLPDALTELEEEAFAGSPAQRVQLGRNLRSVGSRAFADCTALLQAEIPASVTSLAADCFEGAAPTILCAENSAAHRFALDAGLSFVFPAG